MMFTELAPLGRFSHRVAMSICLVGLYGILDPTIMQLFFVVFIIVIQIEHICYVLCIVCLLHDFVDFSLIGRSQLCDLDSHGKKR